MQAQAVQIGTKSIRRTPGRIEIFIGDRLTRGRLLFTAGATIIVGCLLLLISFTTTSHNRTANGLGLGSDYLAFYNAGVILNQYGGGRLYDLSLQARLYHQNLPGEPDGVSLPYANAPFLAIVMRPLATLPYAASYAVWVSVSLALYALGFALVWQASGLKARYWLFGLLMAASFEPFVIECLHGGQVSAVGFAAICATIYLSQTERRFAAGCALSICLYKPTLLPLILPMLLLTRQWKTLAGFGIGAIVLALFCLTTVGAHACGDYLRLLMGYAAKTSTGTGGFQTWKFIDLNSCLKLVSVPTPLIFAILLVIGAIVLADLVSLRPGSAEQTKRTLPLFWAAALTWTLVSNLYVGVYDAVLVVPAVVLTAGALLRRATDTGRNLPLRFRCLLLAVWALPWISGLIAKEAGLQLFTIGLVVLGVYQLRLLRSRITARPRPMAFVTERRESVAGL